VIASLIHLVSYLIVIGVVGSRTLPKWVAKSPLNLTGKWGSVESGRCDQHDPADGDNGEEELVHMRQCRPRLGVPVRP
jgi:hypothetical protein